MEMMYQGGLFIQIKSREFCQNQKDGDDEIISFVNNYYP